MKFCTFVEKVTGSSVHRLFPDTMYNCICIHDVIKLQRNCNLSVYELLNETDAFFNINTFQQTYKQQHTANIYHYVIHYGPIKLYPILYPKLYFITYRCFFLGLCDIESLYRQRRAKIEKKTSTLMYPVLHIFDAECIFKCLSVFLSFYFLPSVSVVIFLSIRTASRTSVSLSEKHSSNKITTVIVSLICMMHTAAVTNDETK